MIATGIAYLIWMMLGFTLGAIASGIVISGCLTEIGMYDEVMEKLKNHLDGMN